MIIGISIATTVLFSAMATTPVTTSRLNCQPIRKSYRRDAGCFHGLTGYLFGGNGHHRSALPPSRQSLNGLDWLCWPTAPGYAATCGERQA